jgi:hypothetical protein
LKQGGKSVIFRSIKLVLNSDNQAQRQYLQCAAFLAVAYMLVFGWLLASTNFLPYVMDNNESFSSYWHALNLAQFDFFKSFGLTDEAYGFSAAAHPYVYTHQGNFPRLFNLLIYALGAHSIESQITVTTFTVGVAAIFMAYHFFSKIANPLFALVCCLLLITDYVLIAQWQVVTYRVWHEFFVFSSMLCVHRMAEGRRYWTVLTVINFACLFYYEFVFVAFVSLASAFYAGFLCRHSPKKALGFWVLQAVGGITALSILALQLYLYLGWDDFKMDAYLTFVARNHFQDSAALLQRMQEFFDSRNIVFWYNLVDGSRFRTVFHFFASLLYFEIQVRTPFLSMLCGIAVLALCATFMFRARSAPTEPRIRRVFDNSRQLIWTAPVGGAVALSGLHFLYKYYKNEFAGLHGAEFAFIALAIAIAVTVIECAPRFRGADQSAALRKAANLLALVILAFNIPSILVSLSYGSLEGGRQTLFFEGYAPIFFSFSIWVFWRFLSERRSSQGISVGASHTGSSSLSVVLLSFLSFFVFFVTLFGKNLILGIPAESQRWFMPAGFDYFILSLIAAGGAAALLHYICRALSIDNHVPTNTDQNRLTAQRKVSIFVLVVTFFIIGSWLLYNPRHAPLWLEMADINLPGPLPYLVTILVVMLASAAVVAKGKIFSELGIIPALKGCGAFLVTGMCAYVVVFILSPGYVFTGYRFRLVPFTAFHTVTLLAFPLYVLLAVGLRYLPICRTLRAAAISDASVNAKSTLTAHPGMVFKAITGIASLTTLGLLTVYWVGVQLTYVRLMPPDHYSFLNKLSEPPYVGKSFLVNTYAAPIAAKTGTWAYLNAKLTATEPVNSGAQYEIPFDATYLWLADKRTNPDYAQPEYFLCVTQQSMSTVIEELRSREGIGEGNVGCERNQLVQLARRGQGKSVYPALEFLEADKKGPDVVGYERWAIVRLNWAK